MLIHTWIILVTSTNFAAKYSAHMREGYSMQLNSRFGTKVFG